MEFGGSRFVVTGHITSWYHTITSPTASGKGLRRLALSVCYFNDRSYLLTLNVSKA